MGNVNQRGARVGRAWKWGLRDALPRSEIFDGNHEVDGELIARGTGIDQEIAIVQNPAAPHSTAAAR